MPEMPEVQAHAERMTAALEGKELLGFELLNFAALKTFDPAPAGAVGQQLLSVGRRAKYLLMSFANGHTHVVHLMQGGRLRPDPKRARKPRGAMARWVFTNGDTEEAWLLTEAGSERKAGVWVVDGDARSQPPLDRLGPEADEMLTEDWAELCGSNSRRLHGLLRDQSAVSGLGRLLANEICFEAGLSPFANASKLDDTQIARLFQAVSTVLCASVEHERTLDDIGKSADRPSKVHNRAGEPCVNCGEAIRTVEYRNYVVFYCAKDQTGGKVLADNTTSKFLK